jgi:hypothetical protein
LPAGLSFFDILWVKSLLVSLWFKIAKWFRREDHQGSTLKRHPQRSVLEPTSDEMRPKSVESHPTLVQKKQQQKTPITKVAAARIQLAVDRQVPQPKPMKPPLRRPVSYWDDDE